jgi:polyhydroxyalkanoate synthesis regulator phasin
VKKRDKTLIAGTAAAFAVVGAGAALAASDALSPAERSQAVIDDAAKQLGVEPSELSDALKHALQNRVDEAVEEGRLTEEQGEALKERIESAGAPLVFGGFGDRPGGPGFGHFHFGFGPFGNLDAAGSYLGLSDEELREALADGKSLAEIAKAEEKSVQGLVDALVAQAEKRIDAAVDDGRLTQEQADELKEDLEERVTELVNHVPGSRRFLPDRRFGPGFGFRDGPFHDHRPDAEGPSA